MRTITTRIIRTYGPRPWSHVDMEVRANGTVVETLHLDMSSVRDLVRIRDRDFYLYAAFNLIEAMRRSPDNRVATINTFLRDEERE